jgi:hypothetical protein
MANDPRVLRSEIFWLMTTCKLLRDFWYFGGTLRLHLHGTSKKVNNRLNYMTSYTGTLLSLRRDSRENMSLLTDASSILLRSCSVIYLCLRTLPQFSCAVALSYIFGYGRFLNLVAQLLCRISLLTDASWILFRSCSVIYLCLRMLPQFCFAVALSYIFAYGCFLNFVAQFLCHISLPTDASSILLRSCPVIYLCPRTLPQFCCAVALSYIFVHGCFLLCLAQSA